MEHIALYRKWRPQTFEDLVGQEHISRTLINAIKNKKLSHAYLFCGPRGTGKTTSARILAKALNCEALLESGDPCNNCLSCKDLSTGTALDVIEIDAASNRGIGEIKNIIEQVRFASVAGKYKVYIIDEFHMLTTEAFNAILKTLEEPPEKVVFVLATTEPHKILPTIISRCQRFDFQRIPTNLLVKRLRYISDQETIRISDDSLLSIARKANGGLRDALSLLDQISSFSSDEGEIATELVYQVLGMISNDFLSKMIEHIVNNEPVEVIKIISELLKLGNDPVVIITEAINYFRHLLVVKSAPDMAANLEVPVINLDELKRLGELFTNDEILSCLEFLNEAIERVKKTNQAQLWLEINFVQLCKKKKGNVLAAAPVASQTPAAGNPAPDIDVDSLVNRISYLEKKLEHLEKTGVRVQSSNSGDANLQAKPKSEGIESSGPKQGLSRGFEKVPESGNVDFDNLWQKILEETRKVHVPAAAVLTNGMLEEIDIEGNFVSVRFENQGFIELMKKRSDKVEQALAVLFGKSLKLRMEKGEFSNVKRSFRAGKNGSKQEAKPIVNTTVNTMASSEENEEPDLKHEQVSAKVENYSYQETNPVPVHITEIANQAHETAEQVEKGNTLTAVMEKPTEVFEPVPYEDEGFIEESYEPSEIIKENVTPYTTEYNKSQINEKLPEVKEVQEKVVSKDRYYEEVAEIFKGKVVNKSI